MFDIDKILYLVTDRTWLNGESLESVVEAAIEGGVNVVQLREKNASREEYVKIAKSIGTITKKYSIPLIINDNIEVAITAGADGVHLGMSDTDVITARKLVGKDFIIGASARTVETAVAAERDGANYLGVGAVFGTSTKADAKTININIFKTIVNSVSIPVIAIGGVNGTNVIQLKDSGAAGIAVVSAILAQKDKKTAAETLAKLIKEI